MILFKTACLHCSLHLKKENQRIIFSTSFLPCDASPIKLLWRMFCRHSISPFLFNPDALGCNLGEDVYAPEPHPPFPASIKDGYAVIGTFYFHTFILSSYTGQLSFLATLQFRLMPVDPSEKFSPCIKWTHGFRIRCLRIDPMVNGSNRPSTELLLCARKVASCLEFQA